MKTGIAERRREYSACVAYEVADTPRREIFTAAGGAFSEFRAGDPVVVDPFASRGAGGFASRVTGVGGAAGSATFARLGAAAGAATLGGDS